MERKSLDLSLELKADDSGDFSAYFAVFGNVDHQGDVIEHGAFKNIPEFLRSGWIASSHNALELPIAYPIDAQQDDKGLLITGRYHSTPTAQHARTVAKERTHAGKAVKGSIGYKVRLAENGQRDGQAIRSLKEIDLYECSFVNLAANPVAELVHAKSLLTPEEARQLVAEFKAGRVLSAANLASMRGWAATLRSYGSIADEIQALCDTHDPPAESMPKSQPVDPTGVLLQTMAVCAKLGIPFLT